MKTSAHIEDYPGIILHKELDYGRLYNVNFLWSERIDIS